MHAGSWIYGTISKHQRWPEKALILERSETQYAAMVTKLLSLYHGAHLVNPTAKNQTLLIHIG